MIQRHIERNDVSHQTSTVIHLRMELEWERVEMVGNFKELCRYEHLAKPNILCKGSSVVQSAPYLFFSYMVSALNAYAFS